MLCLGGRAGGQTQKAALDPAFFQPTLHLVIIAQKKLMEGFWGILKRECYYGHIFTSRSNLISAIANYIDYYNNRRYQHRLFIQTPMQAHIAAMNRAA